MADNVNVTAGAGTPVATDDIGGVHFQRQKVAIGPDGTHTADLAGRAIGSDGVAYVDPRFLSSTIIVASGGLTIATTAYSIGDQLGTLFSFTNAVRASGGTGIINGVTILDEGDVMTACNLVLFRASVTLAADNAAFAVSDTDMRNAIAMLQLPGFVDMGANRLANMECHQPYDCSGGTTLYGALITLSANAVFTAVTDLQVTLFVTKD